MVPPHLNLQNLTSNVQNQLNTYLIDNSSLSLSSNYSVKYWLEHIHFAGATPTELIYVHGVTSAIQKQLINASAIQTQLNNKQVSDSYATTADLSAQFSSLTSNYTAANTVITTAYTAADVELCASLTSTYTVAIAAETYFCTLTKNNVNELTSILQ